MLIYTFDSIRFCHLFYFLENQIRGLNEDESAYLTELRRRDHKVGNLKKKEEDRLIGELKRNQGIGLNSIILM